MERTDDILQKRMAEETAKINVDSYQKTASLGGWAGGGRTLWAISAVGAVAGAMIGVVAPFFPLVVGASTGGAALAAIPASAAVFASIGMGTGFTGGLVLGRITGSNAAVAAEQEKRLKEWTAKQLLAQNPDAKIVEDKVEPKPEDKRSFWQKVKDGYSTYINPRVGAFFTVIGAMGGAIMAAAFILSGGAAGGVGIPAMSAVTGLSASALTPPVIAAYTVGVMAAFGALFNFNFPKITSDLTEITGRILGGKPLGREWGPKEVENTTQLSSAQLSSAQLLKTCQQQMLVHHKNHMIPTASLC
jgi:hypothetical protein